MSGFRLQRTEAALLVVDVQEKLAAAMPKEALERMLNRTSALVEGARVLGLPIVFTEQYPKGLGHTVLEVGIEDSPGAPGGPRGGGEAAL